MNRNSPASRRWAAAGLCLFFFLAGLAFIPLAGIQSDEALFSAPLYEPAYEYGALVVLGKKIPLMLISYLGALKSWVYWIVFKLAPPSVWSVRLPVLMAGALTVWLFWRLAERLGGFRAALIAGALLATDVTFVTTTVLDWGPVAFQHLFLVALMLLAVRFHDTGSARALFGVFLLAGLALWDKAIFLWMAGGLVAAAVLVLPAEVRRALSWRNASLAAGAFYLGALPLICHNALAGGETLRENTSFTLAEIGPKAIALFQSLSGRSLFGYLVGEDWYGNARMPKTVLEHLSVWLSRLAGEPRTSLLPYVVAVAALCLPLVWRTRVRRAALFTIVLMAVAWLQMAITRRAGASAHHTVLLWPLPHLLVGLAAAGLVERFPGRGRLSVVLAAALACGSNFLILNQYFSQMVRYGSPSVWSDAILTLTRRLAEMRPDHVFMMDWGTIDNVRLLSRGRLPVHVGMDVVGKDEPDEADLALFRRMVALPNSVFVTFTDRWEQVEGTNRRLAALASRIGCRAGVAELVHDRNRRPVFRILRICGGHGAGN